MGVDTAPAHGRQPSGDTMLKSMTVGGMLRLFSASQVGRYSINRHVAGGAGRVSRHDNTVSSGSITMVNPLREA